MSSIDDNKRSVLRYFELLTRNDVDGLMALYDESMTLHVSGNTLTSGTYSKAQLAELAGLVVNVFPAGLVLTVTGMVAEGDTVAVQVESTGELHNGRSYHNQYHTLMRFRDGQIAEVREYQDTHHAYQVWHRD